MYINRDIKPGESAHSVIGSQVSKKQCHTYCYRHPDGTIHQCVGISLADCQAKARQWKTEYDARVSKTKEVGIL